eukprot:1655230-Amphidinium_carterae.1
MHAKLLKCSKLLTQDDSPFNGVNSKGLVDRSINRGSPIEPMCIHAKVIDFDVEGLVPTDSSSTWRIA